MAGPRPTRSDAAGPACLSPSTLVSPVSAMRIWILAALLPALAACGAGGPDGRVGVARQPAVPASIPTLPAPPDAAPGTCWARDETPAVVETVTERVVVEPAGPAPDGTLRAEPLVREVTANRIVEPRREVWFQTACDGDLTPGAVESLQRALAVRGLYDGPVTGALDAPTRAAIRAFQAPRGLDSAVLSMAAARQLGLAAVERPVPAPGAAGRR